MIILKLSLKYVTVIILLHFIALNHEIEPNIGKVDTENIMQITENFIFGHWQGAHLNSKIA